MTDILGLGLTVVTGVVLGLWLGGSGPGDLERFLGAFATVLLRPKSARGRHRPRGGRHRHRPAPRPAATLYSPAGRGHRP